MFHILIDSEVFRRENLHFSSRRFQRLKDLVDAEAASVYVTDVIEGEVRRAIKRAVAEAAAVLSRSTKRALGPLVQIDRAGLGGLLGLRNQDELASDLGEKFDSLLESLQVKEISSDKVEVAEIRTRYFQSQPPFSKDKAQKSEFPDALIVLAAANYARENHIKLYVVSADNGIKKAATSERGLEPIKDLDAMINLVHKEIPETSPVARQAEKLLEEFAPRIESLIKEQVENAGFTLEDDWTSEVLEALVTVEDLGEPMIDKVEGSRVELYLMVEVSIKANVSIADPSMTTRDSETGELLVFGRLHETVVTTEHVETLVELTINKADLSASTIDNVSITGSDFWLPHPLYGQEA